MDMVGRVRACSERRMVGRVRACSERRMVGRVRACSERRMVGRVRACSERRLVGRVRACSERRMVGRVRACSERRMVGRVRALNGGCQLHQGWTIIYISGGGLDFLNVCHICVEARAYVRTCVVRTSVYSTGRVLEQPNDDVFLY